MANYDIVGNIAIIKFNRTASVRDKKRFAEQILRQHKNVSTILEKTGKFSGRLRLQKTKYLAGKRTKEALCRENNCVFLLNVDSCYFSPRLASERKEIAESVGKNESVLVMFGGIGVYAIVISKLSKCKKVVSVEISKACNKYANINVKRNKIDNAEIIAGDVRKKISGKEKFDRIVMPRPNLRDSFLDIAFKSIKKNGIIHYYGFYDENEVNELKDLILDEAEKSRKKIKIITIKKAGDVGVRKFRYRVDFEVL